VVEIAVGYSDSGINLMKHNLSKSNLQAGLEMYGITIVVSVND
jgi:hypothetical protein